MSDAAPGGEPRERLGCLLGMTVALLVAFALVAQIAGSGGGAVTPEDVLAQAFDGHADPLPFGLELVQAGRLPGGERLVRLAHQDYRAGFPEPEPASEEPDAGDETAAEGAAELHDEAREEPALVRGAPPVEVVVTVYPSSGPVRALFRDAGGFEEGGSMEGSGTMGSAWTVESGDVEWRAWAPTGRGPALRAPFVLTRAPTSAGASSTRDSARVDLSRGARHVVLSAQWPVGHAGSKTELAALLAAFRLHPVKEPEPAQDS